MKYLHSCRIISGFPSLPKKQYLGNEILFFGYYFLVILSKYLNIFEIKRMLNKKKE
jgi:hypothetical protein